MIANIAFAPLKQLGTATPSDLGRGQIIGMVFVSDPRLNIPAAFYALKVTIGTGSADGQLLDASGAVVIRVAVEIVPVSFSLGSALLDVTIQGDVGVNSSTNRSSLYFPVDQLFIIKITF